LVTSGPDGINKVVEKFTEKYPLFSKRQVEIKINELALKEKREEDSIKVWHIKPEFEFYLHLEEKDPSSAEILAATASNPLLKKGLPKGPKKKNAVSASGEERKEGEENEEETAVVKTEKEAKDGGDKVPKSASKSVKSESSSAAKTPVKRKASDANLDDDEAHSPVLSGSTMKEPKKAKTAFGLFVKAKRAEAEAKLGPDASVIVYLDLFSLWFLWFV
jgi:hypothetical protein